MDKNAFRLRNPDLRVLGDSEAPSHSWRLQWPTLNHCFLIPYGYSAWGTPISGFREAANHAVERTSGTNDDGTRWNSRAAFRSSPILRRSLQENHLRVTLAPVATCTLQLLT
ncbi:hypothetical protein DPMN_029426 [Dreissena polymorpha]|uniref:Uncharacterized protein n=1 Tax=Dreissena polymorpha TaxID=45954 RepID=A0A9D4LZ17_DREPO|nr:hypothetical protein DPMN_029426 [Dreissena polymorpha]